MKRNYLLLTFALAFVLAGCASVAENSAQNTEMKQIVADDNVFQHALEPAATAVPTVTLEATSTPIVTVASTATATPIVTVAPTATATPKPTETPTPIPDVRVASELRLSSYQFDYPGQSALLDTVVKPATAITGLTVTSSDPSIAIYEDGYIKTFKAGKCTITAVTNNGIKATATITVSGEVAKLTCEPTKDGSGYIITGCNSDANIVHIPANYNNLPIKEIADRAFINCKNLAAFTADEEQQYFKVKDRVLYSKDDKILVRFPNRYDDNRNCYQTHTYIVEEGTEIIGRYAFSGLRELRALFIPDGVTTIEDCAFSEVNTQVKVYIPDSLVHFGSNLMKNQRNNVPFYGSRYGTVADEYCKKNQIPYGAKFDYTPVPATAGFAQITPEPAEGYGNPKNVKTPDFKFNGVGVVSIEYIYERVDISEYQTDENSEIRIMLQKSWAPIIPDENGNTRRFTEPLTGVYGAGYTATPAKIAGYDVNGKVIGYYNVDKNFIFSFPGAVNIGITGGSETFFYAIPFEPKFVTEPGVFALKYDDMIKQPGGWILNHYILAYPYASISINSPAYLNMLGASIYDSKGNYVGDRDISEYYTIATIICEDEVRAKQIDLLSVSAEGMRTIYDDEDLIVLAKNSYDITPDFGEGCAALLNAVKETMVGVYYPAEASINKISIMVNDHYPSALESKLTLSAHSTKLDDSTKETIVHELVHCVDQSLIKSTVAPAPWGEGRAEYIGEIVSYKLGIRMNYHKYTEYDWSFLSEEEKADFFHYFYYSTNRSTPYPVGYLFMKYISEKYGEDVSSKIMHNFTLITENIDGWINDEKQRRYEKYFKKAVVSATSDTVFQDFVRDVVNK